MSFFSLSSSLVQENVRRDDVDGFSVSYSHPKHAQDILRSPPAVRQQEISASCDALPLPPLPLTAAALTFGVAHPAVAAAAAAADAGRC